MFLSTKSAVGFWSHFALEVVEKVVLAVYLRAGSFKTRFLCVCVCVYVCVRGVGCGVCIFLWLDHKSKQIQFNRSISIDL